MTTRQRLTTGLVGLISLTLFLTGVLAGVNPVEFRTDHDWLSPLVILLGAGVYLGMLGLLFRWLHRRTATQHRWLSWGLWGLLLAIQLVVAFNWVNAPRADLYFVHQQALTLLHGDTDWSTYFYTYPNNINFTLVLTGLMKAARTFGTTLSGIDLNLIQFAWLDCGLLALWQVLRRHNIARGHLFLIIIIGTVPLYAYALNTYSDLAILPISLLVLAGLSHLLHASTWPKRLGWTLFVGLFLTFAVLIKANFIVLVIAVILGLWLVDNASPRPWLARTGITALLIVMLGAGIGGSHAIQRAAGYQQDPALALPATSWIAMSWNPTTHGEYSRPDVDSIRNKPTAARKQALAKKHLEESWHTLGIGGSLYHLAQKAKLFLATGTFDAFQISPEFEQAPNWYRQQRNTVDWLLANWCQLNYLALLIVTCGWGLQQIRRRQLRATYLIGGLFIIGLICFHVIFWETEERYALPILPLLVAGTAAGYRQPLNLLRWSTRSRWIPLGMALVFSGLILVSAWQNKGLTTKPVDNPIYVLTQNEGRYFQNHHFKLKPGRSLTQPLTAPIAFDQLSIDPNFPFRGRLTLRNAQGKVVWHSPEPDPLIQLKQILPVQPAGHYRLTITNLQPTPVKFVTAPATFPVLPQPIVGHPDQYLRFHLTQRNVSPVIDRRQFWLVLGTIWLSGLLIIDRFYWYRRQI